MSILEGINNSKRSSWTPSHIIARFSSASFKKKAEEANENPEINARLTIVLLEEMSIDPSTKGCPRKMVGENDTTYCIYYHTVSNPFQQLITLPNDSPLISEMDAAIAKNLESKMYKAAKMYRRIQPKIVKADAKVRRTAESAYYNVINQKKGKEAADAAFDAAFDQKRIDQLDRRIRFVSHTACPSIAGKGYTEWLAEFIYKHL